MVRDHWQRLSNGLAFSWNGTAHLGDEEDRRRFIQGGPIPAKIRNNVGSRAIRAFNRPGGNFAIEITYGLKGLQIET
jgi:hypothetical protein